METERNTFRGNAVSLFFRGALNAAIFLFLLSFIIFGKYGLRIYAASLIIMLPILFIIVLQNRFRFDDGAKAIVKPIGSAIPYGAIRSITLHEARRSITVLAGTGSLSRRLLVQSLARKEKDRVLDELSGRMPDVPVKQGRSSVWRIIMGMELAILIIFMIMTLYIYSRSPQVKTTPEIVHFEKAALIDYRLEGYTVGSFSFRLPPTFKLFTKLSNGYMFKQVNKTAKMRVMSGMYDQTLGKNRKYLERATGLKGIFEFYRMAYYARFGIVPLMFKVTMMGQTDDPKIIQIDHDVCNGFIMEGIRDGQHYAHILLQPKNGGDDLHIIIFNDKPGNERIIEVLMRYLNSVTI